MTKRILVAGDSYSSRWWKTWTHKMDNMVIPTIDNLWPEIILDTLQPTGESAATDDYLILEQMCKGGVGNDWIVDKIVPYIINKHDKIKYVLILWTDFFRFSMHNSRIQHVFCSCRAGEIKENLLNKGVSEFISEVIMDRVRFADFMKQQFSLEFHKYDPDVVDQVVKRAVLHQFKLVEMVCKNYNIEYYFMQGVTPVAPLCDSDRPEYNPEDCLLKLTEEKVYKSLIKYEKYIDTSRFIGWPLYHKCGGFSFDHLTHEKLEYHVSENDRHPNQLGHELIADKFLDKLR